MRKNARAVHRILVVDDNLEYVQSMALLLRGMGHEVAFAINGTVVLEVARRFRPDIVLLDVELPDGDGRRLAKPLKQHAAPGVRVVVVTGRAGEERTRSLEAGCDDHLLKPLNESSLEALLKT